MGGASPALAMCFVILLCVRNESERVCIVADRPLRGQACEASQVS